MLNKKGARVDEAPKMQERKEEIHVHSDKYSIVKDFKIGDEVSITATGKVVGLNKEDFEVKGRHVARIELSDIKMNNESAADEKDMKEAEAHGLNIGSYLKVKKAKNEALKKMGME